MMVVSCPVRQNGRIQYFATGTALPCIKGAYEIVVLLGEHPASAFRAFHVSLLLSDGITLVPCPVLISNYTRHAISDKKTEANIRLSLHK
jgi:hypothetical protein